MPYNPRQQLIMVSVFEASPYGEVLVGEATIPLADDRSACLSTWPLVHEGAPGGTIALRICLPSGQESFQALGPPPHSTPCEGVGRGRGDREDRMDRGDGGGVEWAPPPPPTDDGTCPQEGMNRAPSYRGPPRPMPSGSGRPQRGPDQISQTCRPHSMQGHGDAWQHRDPWQSGQRKGHSWVPPPVGGMNSMTGRPAPQGSGGRSWVPPVAADMTAARGNSLSASMRHHSGAGAQLYGSVGLPPRQPVPQRAGYGMAAQGYPCNPCMSVPMQGSPYPTSASAIPSMAHASPWMTHGSAAQHPARAGMGACSGARHSAYGRYR